MAEEIPFEPFIKGLEKDKLISLLNTPKPSKIYNNYYKTLNNTEEEVFSVPEGYHFEMIFFSIYGATNAWLLYEDTAIQGYFFKAVGSQVRHTETPKILLKPKTSIKLGGDALAHAFISGNLIKNEDIGLI